MSVNERSTSFCFWAGIEFGTTYTHFFLMHSLWRKTNCSLYKFSKIYFMFIFCNVTLLLLTLKQKLNLSIWFLVLAFVNTLKSEMIIEHYFEIRIWNIWGYQSVVLQNIFYKFICFYICFLCGLYVL